MIPADTLVFEHTLPTAVMVGAMALVVVLVVGSAAKMLGLDRVGMALTALRLLWLAILAWCLWMPVQREAIREEVRPRWIVLLDVSASMTNRAGAAPLTRWDVARSVLDRPWLTRIRDRWAVDLYPFAEDLRERRDPEGRADLVPDGTSTHLRDALHKLAALHRGQPVAGVVVLSDGLDTRENRDDWAGGPWPFAIYPVQIETPAPTTLRPPDVRIDQVETPLRVVVGWNSRMVVTLSGETPADQAVAVRLFRNDQLVQEIPTQLSQGGGARDVVFQLDNATVGAVTYRVWVPPLPGEVETNDNVAVVNVQVVDTQNRLLYVEDVPRWESRQLIRALRASTIVTPLAFVRGPDGRYFTYGGRGGVSLDLTPDQLTGFKIVIVGDLDMPSLGTQRAENLADFVRRGGQIVLLGGPRAWGPEGFESGPLAPVVPFVRRGTPPVLEGRFEVEVTDEGRAHPIFSGERFEQSLPPVLSVFPGAAPKPAAQVLARAKTPSGDHPLVVVQRYGQGKVVALLTESLWRWALEPREEDIYRRFWNRVLDWLAPEKEELQPFEVDLFAPVARVYLGEPIRLASRVGGAEAVAVEVTCEIRGPDGRTLPFRMTPKTITTATGQSLPGYELLYIPEQPGNYQARAVAVGNGKTARSTPFEFLVRSVSAEGTGRPANLDLLKKLAESSGGAFAAPEEIGGIVERWTGEGRQEVRVQWKSLWNQWWAIGAMILLLCIEWIFRRRFNMA